MPAQKVKNSVFGEEWQMIMRYFDLTRECTGKKAGSARMLGAAYLVFKPAILNIYEASFCHLW